jgi:hypothetical protein
MRGRSQYGPSWVLVEPSDIQQHTSGCSNCIDCTCEAPHTPSPLPESTVLPVPLPVPQMRTLNKGIAVDNLHYLTDGLWKTPTI